MIVLLCGGRSYADRQKVRGALAEVGLTPPQDIVVHGGASGADELGAQEAIAMGVHTARVDALWHRHGKSAGPIRNLAMLSLKPDLVLAFPGGRGTANMVAQAKAVGIRVKAIA